MLDDHLLTIGAFARRCGLTASALRFYDDAGMLAPATVDAASGYRFYAPEQADRARQLCRLRTMGMSLAQMVEVWSATVHADDLRAGTSWLRRRHRVRTRTRRSR